MHDLKAIFDPDHGRMVQPKEIAPVTANIESADNVYIGPDDLPGDQRVWFEERAAILEFEGHLPREQAEAQALAETVRQMQTGHTDVVGTPP